ncbi:MAG: RNA polymerase sigma factor [Chloroflexi bacterium]|nr:RNA polymerase sigma factor [Chloroflexota bacterium]OJV98352.1 MAG: hypothetical protein BGO39_16395 [Chloroflexi bacterium 54-19]
MTEENTNLHNTEPTPERLVEQARAGDLAALETLLGQVQPRLYNLALRMLWHPADAEDATQEILIRITTHLGQFRQESSIETWCYRIATNHLLTTRKRRAELQKRTFEMFDADLEQKLDRPPVELQPDDPAQRLMLEETELRCTLGMLLCLDREHRVAYILGEIIGVSGEDGAFITETTPQVYRKRLSRARERVRGFMNGHCGLANPANPCRCHRQLGYKLANENFYPESFLFAGKPELNAEVVTRYRDELQALDKVVGLYRRQPEYAAPAALLQNLKRLFSSGQFDWPGANPNN